MTTKDNRLAKLSGAILVLGIGSFFFLCQSGSRKDAYLPLDYYTDNFTQCGTMGKPSCGFFETCTDIPKDGCDKNDLRVIIEFPCPGYCKPWFGGN